MKIYNNLDDLNDIIDILIEIYDIVRIVDPSERVVYSISATMPKMLVPEEANCYEFWNRNSPCYNCSSYNAICLDRTVCKMETLDSAIYNILTTPILISDKKLVLECLIDVSKDYFFTTAAKRSDNIETANEDINFFNKKYLYDRLSVEINKNDLQCNTTGIIIMNLENLNTPDKEFSAYVVNMVVNEYCTKNENNFWTARITDDEFIMVLNCVDLDRIATICSELDGEITRLSFNLNFKSEFSKVYYAYDLLDVHNYKLGDIIASLRQKATYEKLTNAQDPSLFVNYLMNFYQLTDREKEVADLLLSGHGNRKIGNDLGINLTTVKKHVSKVYEKTGVTSRATFISKFSRHV